MISEKKLIAIMISLFVAFLLLLWLLPKYIVNILIILYLPLMTTVRDVGKRYIEMILIMRWFSFSFFHGRKVTCLITTFSIIERYNFIRRQSTVYTPRPRSTLSNDQCSSCPMRMPHFSDCLKFTLSSIL